MRVVLSQGAPLRIRVDRRLPALSSFFGHRPAQEIGCPAVGKRLMSRPISARMTRALNSSMPGMVVRGRTVVGKGSSSAFSLLIDLIDPRVDGVDLLQMQLQQEAPSPSAGVLCCL